MHLSAIYSIFFLFYATVSGVPQHTEQDIVYSGNYVIYNCGSQAGQIDTLLHLTNYYLQTAIASVTTSNAVYRAFFNGVNPATVKAIFQLITAGSEIVKIGRSFKPTIVCVDESNETMNKFAEACKAPNAEALSAAGSPYVFLCPTFLSQRLIPPSNDCPKVILRSTLLSGGANMAHSQYTILVHELVHVYLTQPMLKPEVYDVNPAMYLPPSESVINPNNYAFFAGHLVGGCTDLPRARGSDPNFRGLKAEADDVVFEQIVQLTPGCPVGSPENALGLC